jgi:hypothetical protein
MEIKMEVNTQEIANMCDFIIAHANKRWFKWDRIYNLYYRNSYQRHDYYSKNI